MSGGKALNVPAPQSAHPLTAPDKYAKRLELKTHAQLMDKILLCDMMLKTVDEAVDDPRQETAKAYHQAQRDLLIAEMDRRKAAGVKFPDVLVGVATVVLGSSVPSTGKAA